IAQFRLHPWNTGNVLLQNFTVTDTLPPELELVRITVGQYSNFGGQQVNIRYRTSADPLTWVNWPGGPFGTNQTLEVSALGLGSGVYIEAIQWQYGTVLPGFQPNSSANRPRLYARIINPDRDGNTVVDGISINNTAELSWDYPPGEDGEGNGNTSGVEPGSASLLVDVIPSPQFDKTSAGGVSSTWRFLIGQQVGYYVLTPNNNSGVALDEFTITDTIPPEFNVTGLTIGQYNNFDGQQVTIRYQSSGAPGVWVEWPGGPFDDNNQTLNVSALGLGGNSIIALQWDFGTVQPDFIPSNAPRIYGRITNPDRNGDPVNDNDPLSNTAVVGWSYDDNDDTLSDTQNDTIRQPVAEPAPQKSITSTGPYIPSSVVSFSLRVMARSNSPSVLVNPVVMDLLPDGLMYVPNSWAFNPGSSGATTPPIFEEIPNYNGTGRTLLRWSFTGAAAHDFPQNQPAYITFNTAITPGAPEGSLSNQYFISSPDIPIIGNTTDVDDLNGNSNSTDSLNGVTTNLTIDELVGLRSVKGVRGELDSTFSVYPDSGYTIPNGEVTYRLSIINEGNIPIQNVRVVDILPFVGDTGVQDLSGRQSQWRPLLTGLVSAPAGVTVYYSTSQNPCRPEIVSSGPAGCTAPNWSTLPPADITTVYSLRFDFSGILNPGSSFNFTWTMRAPGNAPEGEIAWNSFAFTST
ncbi:MAG: hypothetical protein JNJ78_20910, partial [Anaerolineae bacterium]|nr:hypothetical protein [Anaerolineae bacterium]